MGFNHLMKQFLHSAYCYVAHTQWNWVRCTQYHLQFWGCLKSTFTITKLPSFAKVLRCDLSPSPWWLDPGHWSIRSNGCCSFFLHFTNLSSTCVFMLFLQFSFAVQFSSKILVLYFWLHTLPLGLTSYAPLINVLLDPSNGFNDPLQISVSFYSSVCFVELCLQQLLQNLRIHLQFNTQNMHSNLKLSWLY